MRRRAFTLVEMTVTGIILVILMGGLLTVFKSINSAQTWANTMPQVQDNSEQCALKLAGAFRRATLATSADSTCTLNAAVENASAGAVTIYSGPNGGITKTTYANTGANVTMSVNGAVPSVLYTNASIALTYYSSTTYHSVSLPSYTPTSATAPNLIAVQITVTTTTKGLPITYRAFVRLRSGPLKASSTD